jgi:RNA polymerase sigma-70 factor (TIGR02943 family)
MDRPVTAGATDPLTWVETHGDYLYRFALARVRNPEAAEELVQEALLAALSARHSFRGRSSERSWLTAILKRKVVDWLRVQVRRRAVQGPPADRWADGLFTRGGKWKVKPDDWSSDDPGREITRGEFWATFSACLDKLPARLRQAFVLRHLDERAADEVCQALGASATNLWVMLHRARLRLWRCLTVNWFGEDPEGRSEGEPS